MFEGEGKRKRPQLDGIIENLHSKDEGGTYWEDFHNTVVVAHCGGGKEED